MTGHATAEGLSSYLDEELEPEEARRIDEHLDSCASCRQRLEGLRRVMSDLRGLREGSPPTGLGLELQQRLAVETPPFSDRARRRRRVSPPFFQPAFLGSLGVILALGIIMVMFLQALERRRDGDFLQGEGESPSTAGREFDGGTVDVAGRTFERLGGFWVETDLTVAEVAGAQPAERDDLLDRSELPGEVREILLRIDQEVVLRLGDATLRVAAVTGEN